MRARSYSIDKKMKRLHALEGIIIARWFLILSLAILGIINVTSGIVQVSPPFFPWVLLLTVAVLFNLVSMLLVRKPRVQHTWRSLKWISFSQVAVDQLIFTFIIYYTGGVTSEAYVLYFFGILAATILYSGFWIVAWAAGTVLLYNILIVLELNGTIPHLVRLPLEEGLVNQPSLIFAYVLGRTMLLLFTGMFCVFINRIIEDRESELVHERDKVETILYALEDGILLLSPEGKVLLLNRPARAVLNLANEATVDHLDLEQFAEPLRPLVALLNEQTFEKQLGMEIVLEERPEHRTFLQVDSIPIVGSNGGIVSTVKVLHDHTREHELENVKSDFISIAAHQLRTPLAALKWFFRIMIDGDTGVMNEKQRSMCSQAFDRTNEVIDIVNNLLDISEIEEGRFPYQFKKEDVLPVLKATVDNGQVDATQKQVMVQYTAPQTPIYVHMDKQKLKMALQNILDNAIKYSPDASTVTVQTKEEDGRCIVSIADNGIGIPEEEQEKIFTKFYRGSNAKEEVITGSGLGLYIVKNVIQKHSGRIWFTSEVNKGTTFYISLPIAERQLKTA